MIAIGIIVVLLTVGFFTYELHSAPTINGTRCPHCGGCGLCNRLDKEES